MSCLVALYGNICSLSDNYVCPARCGRRKDSTHSSWRPLQSSELRDCVKVHLVKGLIFKLNNLKLRSLTNTIMTNPRPENINFFGHYLHYYVTMAILCHYGYTDFHWRYHVERYCELKQLGGLLDSKGYGIALPKGKNVHVHLFRSKKEFRILDNCGPFAI